MHSGVYSLLHPPADRPVLAIDFVPKINRVRWVEIGLLHCVRFKQKITVNDCLCWALRVQNKNDDVIARGTEKQIGVYQIALVAHLLIVVKSRKHASCGST